MTSQQKFIVTKLLEGCTIFSAGPGKVRLRDPEGRPIAKLHYRTFYWLNRNLLRKERGLFVINKSKVRQLHGNSFAKRLYKGKAVSAGIARNTPPHKSDEPTLSSATNPFLKSPSILY